MTDLDRTPAPAPSCEIDTTLWREFQEGLSSVIDTPLELRDGAGNVIASSGKDRCICDTVRGTQEGGRLCQDLYRTAVSQALEKKRIFIFKCHTNQYVFAVPVFLSETCSFVILGGRSYLEGSVAKDFDAWVSGSGFGPGDIEILRRGIRTIPKRSIFALPGIVGNLATPFLRSLYSRAKAPSEPPLSFVGDGVWKERFRTILQIYDSIAPVRDSERLYDIILAKGTELLGAERGSLMMLDSERNVLTVKAAKGIERSIAEHIQVKVGEGISGTTVVRGVPVVVKNIDEEVPWRRSIPVYKTKSFVSVPLKLEDRVIGVINLSDKATGEVFSEEDLIMMLSFASYATMALERVMYHSMNEELKTISMTDALTGLFNRRFFLERVFEEAERVKRRGERFSSFVIDVDNFKAFNDRFGHMAGDEVLKRIARTIKDAVRSMDVVVRYGGEEFAVILPHTGKKESSVIAERIRKGVEGVRSSSQGVLRECPTVSIGVAEFPKDASSIDDLVKNADRAMYRAKREGKNRVCVYV